MDPKLEDSQAPHRGCQSLHILKTLNHLQIAYCASSYVFAIQTVGNYLVYEPIQYGYTCVHVFTCVQASMQMHVCVHMCAGEYAHGVSVHVCVVEHTRMCTCMFMCMQVSTCVYT